MHLIVSHCTPLEHLAPRQCTALDHVLRHWHALPREAPDESTLTTPHERALAEALGWQGSDGCLPWAARSARQDGIEVGPFKDTSSVALNPVIKFTTLFGLLAVELAVSISKEQTSVDFYASTGIALNLVIAVVLFVIASWFVHRSFYGMRIGNQA